MGKSGGARDGPSGSAAGGLAAVAEIEGADDALVCSACQDSIFNLHARDA
jgi:hypothetical protein